MARENDDEQKKLESQIVEVLITRLEESPSVITYGDLAKKLDRIFDNKDARAWHYFDTLLGNIQDTCQELGLPSLPVMVVRKDVMKPGTGYAAYYRENHPEYDMLTDEQIADQQWSLVKKSGDWQRILDYYGIDRTFEGTRDVVAEAAASEVYEEGRRIEKALYNEIERNKDVRRKCLEKKGYTCAVCGFNSLEKYGVEGIIHVHHLRPLYELAAGELAYTDAEKDVVPVCPNCHALIHSKGPRKWYTLEEARAMVEAHSTGDGIESS